MAIVFAATTWRVLLILEILVKTFSKLTFASVGFSGELEVALASMGSGVCLVAMRQLHSLKYLDVVAIIKPLKAWLKSLEFWSWTF